MDPRLFLSLNRLKETGVKVKVLVQNLKVKPKVKPKVYLDFSFTMALIATALPHVDTNVSTMHTKAKVTSTQGIAQWFHMTVVLGGSVTLEVPNMTSSSVRTVLLEGSSRVFLFIVLDRQTWLDLEIFDRGNEIETLYYVDKIMSSDHYREIDDQIDMILTNGHDITKYG